MICKVIFQCLVLNLVVVPSANFISLDEAHSVSQRPRSDNMYFFILFAIMVDIYSVFFAMMVDLPGWNMVLTFHVPKVDTEFGGTRLVGLAGSLRLALCCVIFCLCDESLLPRSMVWLKFINVSIIC